MSINIALNVNNSLLPTILNDYQRITVINLKSEYHQIHIHTCYKSFTALEAAGHMYQFHWIRFG